MSISIGAFAPDFHLVDQHGQDVSLSGLRGRKAAVVVFYPWAFSSVCTAELAALQEDVTSFVSDDIELLAISCDAMFTQRAFADARGITFALLSDFWPHGQVARAYGVFDERRGCAVRGTFVVDVGGIVQWKVVNAIPDARAVVDYRDALAALAGRTALDK